MRAAVHRNRAAFHPAHRPPLGATERAPTRPAAGSHLLGGQRAATNSRLCSVFWVNSASALHPHAAPQQPCPPGRPRACKGRGPAAGDSDRALVRLPLGRAPAFLHRKVTPVRESARVKDSQWGSSLGLALSRVPAFIIGGQSSWGVRMRAEGSTRRLWLGEPAGPCLPAEGTGERDLAV